MLLRLLDFPPYQREFGVSITFYRLFEEFIELSFTI